MSLSHQYRRSSQADAPLQRVEIPENYDPLTDKGAYMNPLMRAYFYGQLARKADELGKDLASHISKFQQNSNPPDILDRGIVAAEQANARSHIDKQRKLRDKLGEIMAEMREKGDASEYGYSTESGKEIGVGRLMAKPWATKTIDEQERADRQQKMIARPRP